jgi:FMN-dependent NADH-azoreductase
MEMKTLLHIDASANVNNSLSRQLTAGFVQDWLQAHPEYARRYRDLNRDQVPVVTSDLLEAIYAPAGQELPEGKRQALAVSDGFVDEFMGADLFVFGVPMYNFTVPGSFKAYIDQIVRVGKTLARGPKGLEGLVKGRKMIIIATRGGDYAKGGPREGWDFHEPYLRKVFGWLGIGDLTYIPVVNSLTHGKRETHLREVKALLDATGERWERELGAQQFEPGRMDKLLA